jgi:hypothetical protein
MIILLQRSKSCALVINTNTNTNAYPTGSLTFTAIIAKKRKADSINMPMKMNGANDANPPPKRQTVIERRANMPLAERKSALEIKIDQMRLAIAPIVHVCTGKPPPIFPQTTLQLFLLTEAQLDTMAAYYSQTDMPTSPTPSTDIKLTDSSLSPLRYAYPQTMDWSRPFLSTDPTLPDNCKLTDLERLQVKMRMFARFVGMRGAETPGWEIERQVDILQNKIEQSVREEERSRGRGKVFWGGSKRFS